MASSCFLGIRKVKGGEWTAEEKEKAIALQMKAEKALVRKRRAEGYVLEDLVIPLPDLMSLKK